MLSFELHYNIVICIGTDGLSEKLFDTSYSINK